MAEKPTILVTDDEKSIRRSLREILEFEDYTVLEAENGDQAITTVKNKPVDLILLDIKMKGKDGMQILEELQEAKPQTPVIMISGHGNIQIAVEATKAGAFDFIEKPPDLNRLLVSVRNALSYKQLSRENIAMRSQLSSVPPIIGESNAIQKVRRIIDKVAPSDSRVLITGENGTGKELAARWLHEKSRRSSAPFVDVNCAAIPTELLESELFGHEKGAFTGASNQRIGKFEQAHGGTLFLDEVGDMSLDAQAKVLRALQEETIVRVGGNTNISVDVRVIAATNKKLSEEIEADTFRDDLYHRLNVIPIQMPPLRERSEDIAGLARRCLEQLAEDDIVFSGITLGDDALEALAELHWPGNVRELHNVVERLALLVDGNTITAAEVHQLANSETTEANFETLSSKANNFQEFKEEAERFYLVKKLNEHDWNISQTAESIDLQRSHMYTKMKKYDIQRS